MAAFDDQVMTTPQAPLPSLGANDNNTDNSYNDSPQLGKDTGTDTGTSRGASTGINPNDVDTNINTNINNSTNHEIHPAGEPNVDSGVDSTSTSASNSSKIILVTGINGYIASHIGLQLLERDYTVRGTSRSPAAKEHLLTGAFRNHKHRYQHVVVPDIAVPGAFDEAVRGVYGIIHTASPVDFTLTTVDEFMGPAVGGNLSILESAWKEAMKSTTTATTTDPSRQPPPPQSSRLTSFVVTSSVAAIVDKWKQVPNHAYTESDWNATGESVARETFSAPVAYGASKSAAERAVWDWVAAHQPGLPFAVSAINPAVVTGPPVSWPATPDKLNETLLPIWKIWSSRESDPNTRMPPQIGGAGYIDVRDVARMHNWAMEHSDQSNGQRYLMVNGKAPPQAAADLLRAKFPERDIIVGNPGQGYTEDYWFPEDESKLVSSKAYKALGADRFIRYDKSILDTVEAFERQWPGLAKNLKQSK
ncbi:hypothetical protein ABEF93_001167 [Exophiala dermatitidis]